jgi:hypothetical protein
MRLLQKNGRSDAAASEKTRRAYARRVFLCATACLETVVPAQAGTHAESALKSRYRFSAIILFYPFRLILCPSA